MYWEAPDFESMKDNRSWLQENVSCIFLNGVFPYDDMLKNLSVKDVMVWIIVQQIFALTSSDTVDRI